MSIQLQKKDKSAYRKILEAARELPPAEQRRLRDELARSSGVQLVRPNGSAEARRQGRRLVKAIRAELAESVTNSVDETMRQLRGRSWS